MRTEETGNEALCLYIMPGETKDTSWCESRSTCCLRRHKNSLLIKRRIQQKQQSGVFCSILTWLQETCEINKLQIKISPRGQASPQSFYVHLIMFIYCLQFIFKKRQRCIELLCPEQLFTCREPRFGLFFAWCLRPQIAYTACFYMHCIGLAPSITWWLFRSFNVRRDIFRERSYSTWKSQLFKEYRRWADRFSECA